MAQQEFVRENRRSTRVALEVSVEVEGEKGVAVKGVTSVVNLHGALIRTRTPLQALSNISITVYITGKSSRARVVYVAVDNPLKCGIELEKPENIWGVSLAPDDWDDLASGAAAS
jgi:hypothetical protein